MSTPFDPAQDDAYDDPFGAPPAAPAVFYDSILDWDDLTHEATSLAEGAPARTALGGLTPDWQALTAGFACLVQQHVALRRSIEQTGADEGLQVRHTHVLYCRRNRSRVDATLVRLAESGRVAWTDSAGAAHTARVLAVDDEGGQGDHFKVLLYELKPGGD